MRTVDKETFLINPDRYELRKGENEEGAPKCPYGNTYQWIGYDIKMEEYVRFTKSVFKLLVNQV